MQFRNFVIVEEKYFEAFPKLLHIGYYLKSIDLSTTKNMKVTKFKKII